MPLVGSELNARCSAWGGPVLSAAAVSTSMEVAAAEAVAVSAGDPAALIMRYVGASSSGADNPALALAGHLPQYRFQFSGGRAYTAVAAQRGLHKLGLLRCAQQLPHKSSPWVPPRLEQQARVHF